MKKIIVIMLCILMTGCGSKIPEHGKVSATPLIVPTASITPSPIPSPEPTIEIEYEDAFALYEPILPSGRYYKWDPRGIEYIGISEIEGEIYYFTISGLKAEVPFNSYEYLKANKMIDKEGMLKMCLIEGTDYSYLPENNDGETIPLIITKDRLYWADKEYSELSEVEEEIRNGDYTNVWEYLEVTHIIP